MSETAETTETAYTRSASYRRCQALFDRQYPNFVNAGQRYAQLVAAVVSRNPEARLLDVGCGRTSLAAHAIRAARLSAGIDLAQGDLKHNDTVQRPIVADANRIPFRASSFDAVISQWVVEHFDRPAVSFGEMARVLRPGGVIICFTTNALNYIPLVSRLSPMRLRAVALNRLLRRPAHESHRTFYRANTRRALERIAREAGLHLEAIDYVGNPFYLAFSPPLFRLALLYERLTDWQPLRALKLYLLVTLRKPE